MYKKKHLSVAAFVFLLVGTAGGLLLASHFPIVQTSAAEIVREGPDLDVTYISRTPRYYRYDVIYESNIPKLRAGTENDKRWPSIGEQITYTAHVINKGTSTVSSFEYQWVVDGQGVQSSSSGQLAPQEEITFTYQSTFSANAQLVAFKADPQQSITEYAEENNEIEIGSHDLTLSIWVEKGLYDIFNLTLNRVGTFSFEDWIQDHFEIMNKRFSEFKYPGAQNGILDRVRIDKVVVADELDNEASPLRTDSDINKIDGRWQFVDGDSTNQLGINGVWQEYVNTFVINTDWGLIHELTHQLGVIDLYRMNLANDPTNNNRVHVLDESGQEIPVADLPSYAFDSVLFQHQGLMGGGDTSPYNNNNYYESHTVGGMNRHVGFRRGFYGEYLFDTPAQTSMKVLDVDGIAISGAEVVMYQKDFSEIIDNTPEISGITDSQGSLLLPNRPVTGVSTPTGHVLKNNPFGQISVVGQNGTMLVKVKKDGKIGYGWLLIHDLNLAYYLGNTVSADIDVKSTFDPKEFDPENKALNKTATSNRQDHSSANGPEKAVNGDTLTIGNSWQLYYAILPGDWWQVDLGSNMEIAKSVIYPSAQNPADWCDTFHVDSSKTGAFSGEETRLVTETNSLHLKSLIYNFASVEGRYVRITCDNEQNWVQLQEVEIFSLAPIPSITPTPTPTPTRTPTPTPFSANLVATADSYVASDQKTKNYGSVNKIVADSSPTRIGYMKLDLTLLAGKVFNSAKLRIRIVDASNGTQNIKSMTSTSWSETGVTYNSRPGLGSVVKTYTAKSTGVNVDIDLTPFIKANVGKVISIGFDSSSSDELGFNSREASTNKPTLIIQ